MKFCFHIDTPPFDETCGGAKVMHYLAALLAGIGEEVTVTNPCPWNPLIGVRIHQDMNDNVVVIYPEAHRGNRFNVKHSVRYILYFQSKYGEGDRITKDECAIVYQDEFFEDAQKHCDHELSRERDIIRIPKIKGEWCYPEQKRIQSIYYRGKGEDIRPVMEHRVIENNGNHYHTLALLRAASNFYTTDLNTAMSSEAALCGCAVWFPAGEGLWKEHKEALKEAECDVMRPSKDMDLAQKFSDRVYQFFGREREKELEVRRDSESRGASLLL